jgi:hypothetical protein
MAALDLEVWLIGTPAEVTAALVALADVGRLAGLSKPEPLPGNDAGRIRRYARVAIRVTPTGNRPQHQAAGATQQRLTLTDAA